MKLNIKNEQLNDINGGYIRYLNGGWHVYDNSTGCDIITYYEEFLAVQADIDLHNLEFKHRMAANIYAMNGLYGRKYWHANDVMFCPGLHLRVYS